MVRTIATTPGLPDLKETLRIAIERLIEECRQAPEGTRFVKNRIEIVCRPPGVDGEQGQIAFLEAAIGDAVSLSGDLPDLGKIRFVVVPEGDGSPVTYNFAQARDQRGGWTGRFSFARSFAWTNGPAGRRGGTDLIGNARRLMRSGKWRQAADLLERHLPGVSAPEEASRLRLLLGNCYRAMRDFGMAIEIHEEGYRTGGHPSLLRELAIDWLDWARGFTGEVAAQYLRSALETIDRAISASPDRFFSALAIKGKILHAMGRFDEALPVVDEALQSSPGVSDIWFLKAKILVEKGDLAAAIQTLQAGIESVYRVQLPRETPRPLYRGLLILLARTGDMERFREIRDQAHLEGGLSWDLINSIQRGEVSL